VARLNLLFVASECVPFVKTGGLGDVVGALPRALAARGHDVRILLPRYRKVKSHPATERPEPFRVPMPGGDRWCSLWETELDGGVPVYMLEHDVLFDRDGIYNDDNGEFRDNVVRFGLLSRAALELPAHLDWPVDVFHVHDWQTALVPVYARLLGRRAATVLTIHNLGYQGRYGSGLLLDAGIGAEDAARVGLVQRGDMNLLQGGIVNATCLSTVSPRYAGEIQTPLGGAGLHAALHLRDGDLVGILNGIDDSIWNPRTDPLIPERFGEGDLDRGKATCKAELQRELGLPVRPEVPIVGLVSRFASQKGIDIFAGALDRLRRLDVQVAILGSGEAWAEELFARYGRELPWLSASLRFDEGLAHRIEAGADLFVMPSRYEPCGLNQLYSQRYGTLPVVRAVGGLYDTVEDDHTGFVFDELSARALADTLSYAIWSYRERQEHFRAMQRRAMQKRMGWDVAAAQYDALYRLARRKRS
jgi:starch synthase